MLHALLLFSEITVCALLIFLARKYFKDTIGKIAAPVLAAIFIAGLFLANSWVQKIPVVYDEIGIVALGQRNEHSKGTEVSFAGLEMRGSLTEFPEISEGKWFFTTESNYMWRHKGDPRQPEGTTQSIIIKIPVGTDRTLLFKRSDWGGIARVGFWDQKIDIDTYESGKIALKDSGIKRQLVQFAGRLLIFTVIMFAFASLIYLFSKASQSQNEKTKRKAVYAGIALGFFVLTASYLNSQELWLDEMFQIGFSGTGKTLFETLMVTETTPPVFRLLANVWYNIVPYGEAWLLLLPTIFSALFVYTVGLLGEEAGGKYVGFTASVLAAFSSALLTHGAHEFRSNALLALLSALFMLYYVKRLKTGKYTAVFSVIMLLLAYTHYFGVFLCGAAFLLDIYFICCKKKNVKELVAYFIAAALFIPWVLRLLSLGHLGFEASWQPIPNVSAVYNLIIYLCGSVALAVLFILGTILSLRLTKQQNKQQDIHFSFVFIAFIMIACLYAYGTFIRPQATLWSHRYFLNILPCVIVITALGMVWLGRLGVSLIDRILPSLKSTEFVKKIVCIVLVVFLLLTNMPKISAGYTPPKGQDYKGAAETIYAHPDSYRDDSLVVFLCQDYVVDGWYEYYMTMQRKRDDVNCVDLSEIPTDKETAEKFFKPYKTIYLCYLQEYPCDIFTEQINEHYELVQNNQATCVRIYKRID